MKSEISPPNAATCRTMDDERYMCSRFVVKNSVSNSGYSFLLVSAIWNSYSKSDTARRPFTSAQAPARRA